MSRSFEHKPAGGPILYMTSNPPNSSTPNTTSTRTGVLITGVSGFVGQALERRLHDAGFAVSGSARHEHRMAGGALAGVAQLHTSQDWSGLLRGCSAVVHLAARVHIMHDTAPDPLAAFRAANTAGTLHLAQQAVAAGVRRFVFVSTAKVNGEHTAAGRPFRHDDLPQPEDAYAVSKHEAEQGLRALAAASGLELVIVRPPLVYGPGVKANFAALMRAVQRGWPLPLGLAHSNRRSFVGLDNLVDLLCTCLEHPAAANQTFMVSDGHDLSTAELLQRMGVALVRPARLWPVSTGSLMAAAAVLGQREKARRLLGNLQLDIAHTCTTLGWSPPVSVDEGLRRAAAGMGAAA